MDQLIENLDAFENDKSISMSAFTWIIGALAWSKPN